MDNITIPVRAQLCIKNINQISSASRFYGRLDTFSTPNPTTSTSNLYTIHRRSLGTSRCQGLRCFDTTIWPPHKVCSKVRIQGNNNIAQYEGLILSLNKENALRAKIDSQVIAGQVKKEQMARELELIKYLATVRALERRFQGFTLQYILRAENIEADELVKATTNNLSIPNGAFY